MLCTCVQGIALYLSTPVNSCHSRPLGITHTLCLSTGVIHIVDGYTRVIPVPCVRVVVVIIRKMLVAESRVRIISNIRPLCGLVHSFIHRLWIYAYPQSSPQAVDNSVNNPVGGVIHRLPVCNSLFLWITSSQLSQWYRYAQLRQVLQIRVIHHRSETKSTHPRHTPHSRALLHPTRAPTALRCALPHFFIRLSTSQAVAFSILLCTPQRFGKVARDMAKTAADRAPQLTEHHCWPGAVAARPRNHKI